MNPQETTTLVRAIQQNSLALGLTWQLRPATASGFTDDDGRVEVALDGDDLNVTVLAVSLIGALEVAGLRVMTLAVDPSTIYVIGYLESGAWKDYTPTITATTPPVVADGEIAGRYRIVGKTVFYTGYILFGAASTFGAGTWIISMPISAMDERKFNVGTALMIDASTVANRRGGATDLNTTGTGNTFVVYPGSGGVVTATVPFTWAASDRLAWSMVYEAA